MHTSNIRNMSFYISISTYLYMYSGKEITVVNQTFMHQIKGYDSCRVWLNALHLQRWGRPLIGTAVVSNEGKKSRIHNVDQHFASPNVVISLQIICLPLDCCRISTHSSSIFPSVLTAPNFIALCQSGLEITVTDTHPAHFRGIISMLSVRHEATQHQSLAQDHYQKLLPLWPGHFIPAI